MFPTLPCFHVFFADLFSNPSPTPAPAGMRVRHTVLTTGLVIDSPLDAQKLEHSLTTLLERKFPRAGARLAIRNTVYEFHIPCTFDSDTPALAFTADHHREPYRSPTRPDLKSLLNCSDLEPLFCPFPSLRRHLVSKTCPTSTAEFVRSNTPLLHVHVSVFDDLTLIGITSPRLLFDVPGIGTLLHAWTRLLAGDDIDVIPGMDWDTAPFDAFRCPSSLECLRGYARIIPIRPIDFSHLTILRLETWIWRWTRDREERRLVRVPKAFLEDRRRQIMENLNRQESSELVTTSDVLLAWWVKTSHSFPRSDDWRNISIHIPIDLRSKHIFPDASALTKPYINNASSTISVRPFAIKTLQAESLDDLALRIRRATTLYNTDLPALEDELRWRNLNLDWKIFNIYYCAPGTESELQANWCDVRLSGLDFSAARAPGSEKRKRARVVFVLPDVVMAEDYMSEDDLLKLMYPCPSLRGNGAILMEDENALWMSQVKGRKEWEKLRRSGRFKFI
ncbi:hypothetical protein C8J57DRAFT_1267224 [Mycena rebaudengoi]|nr:hypothetical protein C8J57DRAFT_1267224 [Mycena rebaudengoi]